MNKKDKAFLSNTHIYYSKGFLRRKGENCILNIFSEVKEYLTARQVAENYGLQVRRNGLACCPFHDDKHPSMKIDKKEYTLEPVLEILLSLSNFRDNMIILWIMCSLI